MLKNFLVETATVTENKLMSDITTFL